MNNPVIKYIGPKSEIYSDRIIYSSIQECWEYCKDKKELGEDIETTIAQPKGTYKNEDIYKPGLDPYLSKVVMLQIGDKDQIFVIDTRSTDITPLLPLWEDEERVFYGHNLKFEAKHLLHGYGIVHHRIYDCMLVDMILTNGLGWTPKNKTGIRYSLEALAGRYLGIKPVEQKDLFTIQEDEEDQDAVYIDKSIRMGFLSIGDKLFTEEQILYGANDILYPALIKKRQALGYKGYQPKDVIELENEFCLVLADIELKGLTFDKQQWISNYEENLAIYNRRKEKLDKWVIENHKKHCIPPDMFQPEYKCAIEWSSSKQVIKLFKEIGFCPKEKSKQTGYIEYTVGAKALLKLLQSDYKELYEKGKETDIKEQKDLILNYLLLSTSQQAITTFGIDFLKYIHPITGRLHSTYRQILHTGRISSNNPNLQNIPADKGYRKAFVAPQGYTLLNDDYSSQESRILAEVSGDEAMISFFNDGHPVHGSDYHSFTGTKMFSLMRNDPTLIVSKETHPEERNAAKNISFKIAYGGSAYTLKDDFGVEEEVAQEFIDSYMKAFPSLDKYFKDGRELAVKRGYIEMVPDRRYWDHSWEYMKELTEKAWAFYPKNYKDLSDIRKKEVKEQINAEHPEIKGIWSQYFSLKGSLERCSQNYPIQSLAGSQTKKAGVLFRKYQIENNLRDKMYLTNLVHDEALAESVTEYAEQANKVLIESMINGANEYCKKVKMGAAGGPCLWWGH